VDARLAAVVARFVGGEPLNVSAECAALGVSTQTFYKYVRRFRGEGVEGFFPRSRRPKRSPTAVAAVVEDAIVLARKVLDDAGLDVGATSIGWWLQDHSDRWREPDCPVTVPSRATINRVLDRRGLLARHPRRRPRCRYRRFTRGSRNELWQMDGYDVALADGRKATVIEIIDDHSRLCLAAHPAVSENGHDVWSAFTAAVDRYGLPRQLLTDNGAAFNGSRRGWTSPLEAATAELGIEMIPSSAGHPQTCGKVERGHATARRWLRRQPAAPGLPELAEQLESYREIYNNRRHQALGGLTPTQAWALAPVSGPYGTPLAGRLHVTTIPVSSSGCIAVDGTDIGLGRTHKHKTATVFRNLDDVAIFIDGTFHSELTIDRTRRYQPTR
jgi:Integrase core domain/leucine-zipper of insertion element IS481